MRKALEEQSREAKEDRAKAFQQSRERKRNKKAFRHLVYAKLELSESEIAALEWLEERPDPFWAITRRGRSLYPLLERKYPRAHKFLAELSIVRDAMSDDWLKTEVFPDDSFDILLTELPKICQEHALFEDRYANEYRLEERRKSKRRRVWFAVWAILFSLILIVTMNAQ